MINSHNFITTPVGTLTLVADPVNLLAVLWEKEPNGRVKLDLGKHSENHPILKLAKKQLSEYFEGKRENFNLPHIFRGTDFQNRVWGALQDIPFGETSTYSEIASRVGSPYAQRAVGLAVGKNPFSIMIPCHRVLGINGTLTGFAGGLKAKSYLLCLENQERERAKG